jgi:hypothetical protein
MKPFILYLKEQDASIERNLHIPHLEDLIIFQGQDGVKKVLDFFENLIQKLEGEDAPIKINTKVDGAPSLFAGINPENGKFFVATKSLFNKLNPKINYTFSDIDENHENKQLNHKLKVARKYLPRLGIKTILNGDMLFTKDDLEIKNIHDKKHYVFRPNTITYAVEVDSDVGKKLAEAELGIIFHTEYVGDTIASLKPKHDIDVDTLNDDKSVWYRVSDFNNISTVVPKTKEDVQELRNKLIYLNQAADAVPVTVLDKIEHEPELSDTLSKYINFLVRRGELLSKTADKKVEAYKEYLKEKFSGEISTLKSEQSKQKRLRRLKYLLDIVDDNKQDFKDFFVLYNRILKLKTDVLMLYNKIQRKLEPFLDDGKDLIPTEQEGLILTTDDGVVKIVDRDIFSRYNFNLPKNWDKK